MSLDLEKEYNNRARVPEHPGIIQGWAKDSAAYREAKPPREIAYGDGERHRIDFFEAGDGPIVVYIHGGYWQAVDKSFHSIHARGLNALGVSVAVPSYDLCPNVRIGDIVEQMRAAVRTLSDLTNAPVIVAGHSAGGHLAACMLATEAHVPAAYSISGLFDLSPLIHTSLNAALRLDQAEAEGLSPLFWPAPVGKTLDAVVGQFESDAFVVQSQCIVMDWKGVNTLYDVVHGANHFTVIAPLTDPASQMCERIKQMVDAAR